MIWHLSGINHEDVDSLPFHHRRHVISFANLLFPMPLQTFVSAHTIAVRYCPRTFCNAYRSLVFKLCVCALDTYCIFKLGSFEVNACDAVSFRFDEIIIYNPVWHMLVSKWMLHQRSCHGNLQHIFSVDYKNQHAMSMFNILNSIG